MKTLTRKSLSLALCLALVLTVLLGASSQVLAETEDKTEVKVEKDAAGEVCRISVQASGRMLVEPEFANVRLAVEAQAPTAKEANAKNNESMNKIFDLIKELGIAEDDYYTSNYSIWPQTNYNADIPEVYAFEVDNEVTIKVRDLSQLSTVIEAALDAGANRVNDISFDVEDTSKAYEEAMTKALARAQEKALLLANFFGKELSEMPVEIHEISYSSDMAMNRMAYDDLEGKGAAGSFGTPLAQQNIVVVAELNLVYEIH